MKAMTHRCLALSIACALMAVPICVADDKPAKDSRQLLVIAPLELDESGKTQIRDHINRYLGNTSNKDCLGSPSVFTRDKKQYAVWSFWANHIKRGGLEVDRSSLDREVPEKNIQIMLVQDVASTLERLGYDKYTDPILEELLPERSAGGRAR